MHSHALDVSLLVRLWVEIKMNRITSWCIKSASLWGCELKYYFKRTGRALGMVSLLVRLWVEILTAYHSEKLLNVSLLVRLWVEMVEKIMKEYRKKSQPPCEAVSWNEQPKTASQISELSASLWGCKLKYKKNVRDCSDACQPPCEAVSWNNKENVKDLDIFLSASLWGCELKLPAVNPETHTLPVSLLVRLWVEIQEA